MIETIRAAFVIARRDFTAIIFSKSFFFFLLGPLFPIGIAVAAGGLGAQVSQDIDNPVIGIAMGSEAAESLMSARSRLSENLGTKALPEFIVLADISGQETNIIAKLNSETSLTAILSGTLNKPVLTGSERDVKRWQGKVALLAETALSQPATVDITTTFVGQTSSSSERNQLLTAQAGQAILILLTMILAGMVLSNLVEEKTNKIIEILAAAIPMDAIFLGKLFAMLGMALVGITVWSTMGLSVALLAGGNWAALPSPAVGWPLFCLLLILYFPWPICCSARCFSGLRDGHHGSRGANPVDAGDHGTIAGLLSRLFLDHQAGRTGRMVCRVVPVQLAVRDDRPRGANGQYLATWPGADLAGCFHDHHHPFFGDAVPP
ncbi:ABC transporter permease [Sphingopyxis sp. BSNA05]|uniref:ABC transporter permease n=1 Tax=Sphingopyxis sp. BSNA05 TaxID=1236614 RepID=UPI00349F7B16